MPIVLILLSLFVFIIGFYMVGRSGIKKNLSFFFSWMILFLYTLITPVYFYFNNREFIFGTRGVLGNKGRYIGDFYETGFLIYLVANFVFLFAYFLFTSGI